MTIESIEAVKQRIINEIKSSGIVPEDFDITVDIRHSVDGQHRFANQIIDIVCRHYEVTRDNLRAKSSKREYVNARAAASFFLRSFTKLAYREIDFVVRGKEDHSAPKHYIDNVYPTTNLYPDERAVNVCIQGEINNLIAA